MVMRRRALRNSSLRRSRHWRSSPPRARSRSESQREEVAERYRQAGADVLRTYDDGAIIVESDGKTLRYYGYKSGKTGIIDLSGTEKD